MPIRAAGHVLLPVTGSVSGLRHGRALDRHIRRRRRGSGGGRSDRRRRDRRGDRRGRRPVRRGRRRPRRGRRPASSWSSSPRRGRRRLVVVVVPASCVVVPSSWSSSMRTARAAVVRGDQAVAAGGVLAVLSPGDVAVERTVRSHDEERTSDHRVDLVVARLVLARHDEGESVAAPSSPPHGRAAVAAVGECTQEQPDQPKDRTRVSWSSSVLATRLSLRRCSRQERIFPRHRDRVARIEATGHHLIEGGSAGNGLGVRGLTRGAPLNAVEPRP